MRVRVRFFAAAREAVGDGDLVQEMTPGATMGDLRDALYTSYPPLRSMRLRFAVNAAYASADTGLSEGDEVACIPPVGGG